MVQNGSKWFEIVCSYCSFRLVLSSTAVYTQGLLTSEVKKAVNKMNCGCHMDPSHFFLSPQFIANWPDFRLNLNQLLNCSQRCSRFQVVIEQHWACALTCTDLHCIALRYCVFCHVLPCFAFGPVAYKAALTSVACLPRWCNQSSTSLQAVAAMQHVMRSPANFPVSKHVQSVWSCMWRRRQPLHRPNLSKYC